MSTNWCKVLNCVWIWVCGRRFAEMVKSLYLFRKQNVTSIVRFKMRMNFSLASVVKTLFQTMTQNVIYCFVDYRKWGWYSILNHFFSFLKKGMIYNIIFVMFLCFFLGVFIVYFFVCLFEIYFNCYMLRWLFILK